jgi:hypothetical protein
MGLDMEVLLVGMESMERSTPETRPEVNCRRVAGS